MWQKNNGQTEAEKLQNRFTAYLLKAVRRQQRDYMIKKNQQTRYELLVEDDTYQAGGWMEKDILDELPLMLQLESAALQYALEQISERERYVFLARGLYGISFNTLGAELGLGYKGVAAVYYRAIRKIKEKMKEAGQNEF
ncbi:sigma-70 family RNA polymerase sigma factor [Lacrimispora amygdalina]|uniref:Sigma-70 family RNA polymerase sigma factor n=1 Tax=Lacrimispora amygdalina TaxID=253257 RepID=A0A3E2N9A6_9FIRM|nr:sigma-70 family RNA polymerase sigma factor [Clostridium indicum]RFZ77583.1 sigma-70 family RNA polymerase sigma factor [Clostridium indicum]